MFKLPVSIGMGWAKKVILTCSLPTSLSSTAVSRTGQSLKISQLSTRELSRNLRNGGINVKIGPFTINLSSSLASITDNLNVYYRDYRVAPSEAIADFYIKLDAPSLLRRWLRPQVTFSFDSHIPFKPLPQSQAFAMFEWGLNWVIANHAHQFLIIHAAVLEKQGKALIFPGTPGSGKSTLCAGLVTQGWRLLSDEMALVSMKSGKLIPVPRPISLKNESINIIKTIPGEFYVGSPVYDTAKGTVAHMRVPEDCIAKSEEQAKPAAIIFPKYRKGSTTDLSPLNKGQTFLALADNSFNYHVLGARAFNVMTALIDQCGCYDFTYQHLDEAYTTMEGLIDG